jgi:hypothetical protein
MSRSEAQVLEQNEANVQEIDDEPGPVIVSISRAERTFRWISEFRNEPRFELAPAGSINEPNPPDRAA